MTPVNLAAALVVGFGLSVGSSTHGRNPVGETETPSLAGCSVVGSVVDASGHPVVAATVVVWPRSLSQPVEGYQPPSAETGSDGRFQVDAVPHGSASLIVDAPGRPFLAVRGRATPCPPEAGRVGTDLGELRLPREGELRGRVVDGVGDPVFGVAVEFEMSAQDLGWLPLRYWSEPRATTETGADGNFRIPGLAVGSEVALRLRAEGYVRKFARAGEIVPDGLDMPNLVLEAAGAIRLRVVDERTGWLVPEALVMPHRVGEE